ncbi:MAG TPA: aspartate aminotransferase family protein [Armatimonadota bacterium]
MDSSELKQSFLAHVCQTTDSPMGLVIERAEGASVFTSGGREYLDLISGLCVCNVGHCHPEVVAAVREQAGRYLHPMVYGEYVMAPQVELARELAEVAPGDLSVVYFTNSGTESNEGALKLAKKYTGRRRLVSFERSYHGDSHGSLSVTGRDVYRDPFLPLLPDVTFLPFDDVSALSAIDESVAGVIVEPIQGEGGIRVPSPGFLPALRRRCTEAGALLIFDEVQTGFGRTGKVFAAEHWGVAPDIMTLAKALGGGMPLGAFVSTPKIMACLRVDPPLAHVTTFGGHPVCCAAGLAALRVLRRARLAERAEKLGESLRQRLRDLDRGRGLITEVRGLGLMIGMQMRDGELTSRVAEGCFQRGLILGWTLHTDRVIRVAPPLNIAETDLDRALDRLSDALDAAA